MRHALRTSGLSYQDRIVTVSKRPCKGLCEKIRGDGFNALYFGTHGKPFDEFVQDYWSECAEAADVLRLPPDIAPKAVQYVNNVLRYAYDQFIER